MLSIAKECPICFAGAIGFRTCDDGITVVLMCDECDAVWLKPDEIKSDSAVFPKAPNYTVSDANVSIASPRSHWSSRSEIEFFNWTKFISGEGKALDE